tara:strand:- start:2999 stop:3976 length:978 start_codon:yes stop_codon:yes gene_type:complete
VQDEINSDVEVGADSEAVVADVSDGSTGLLDDGGIDQEPVEAAPEPEADFSSADEQVEKEPAVEAKSFDPMFSDIDDQELNVDDFYKGITEQDIKELPTVARRMLHNFRVAYKNESKRLNDAHESRVSQYKKREQQIESLERDFARRQAEFASIIEDPRIKEALKQDESEMPDIMSEEGIQARINRGVAEAVSSVFEPMQEISSKRRQESAYFDFLEANPEMKKPDFRKEVAQLVTNREKQGNPLSTQDAYEIVKARKLVAEDRSRKETRRKARADAARRVQRNSVSGSPSTFEIPPDVKKQGAASIAAWLQSNPEAAKAYSNNR